TSCVRRRQSPAAGTLPPADPAPAARPAEDLPRVRRRRRQDVRDAPGGPPPEEAGRGRGRRLRRDARPGGDGRPGRGPAPGARPRTEYHGVTLEEMDLDAVLARRPTVALVDELAHTNAPGSRHGKRYQDVEDLLRAGINVISTLNVQHLESLHDMVERATGV